MSDGNTGIKAAWIVGGLTLAGAVMAAIITASSNSPTNQQTTKGDNLPIISNTNGSVTIGASVEKESAKDD